jgi:hypothetical protein
MNRERTWLSNARLPATADPATDTTCGRGESAACRVALTKRRASRAALREPSARTSHRGQRNPDRSTRRPRKAGAPCPWSSAERSENRTVMPRRSVAFCGPVVRQSPPRRVSLAPLAADTEDHRVPLSVHRNHRELAGLNSAAHRGPSSVGRSSLSHRRGGGGPRRDMGRSVSSDVCAMLAASVTTHRLPNTGGDRA